MYIQLKGFSREPGNDIVVEKIPIETVIKKLLAVNMAVTSVSLVLEKGNHQVMATANCVDEKDEQYPGIWVNAEANGEPLECSSTELPNRLHRNEIATYLFPGRKDQEREDWVVSIIDGERMEGDESRRIILVDETIASGISARNTEFKLPTPTTEKEANERGIKRLF